MGNLTCTCASDIHMSAFPNNCGANDYGYPKLLLFCKASGADLATATYAAVSARVGIAGANNIIVVGPMTNGMRSEADRQTESGADTIDGLENIISVQHQIDGRLKFLDETIRQDLAQLNCNDRLKMWYVTSTGWFFGDVAGYDVPNFITGLIQEGYGKKSYIPVNYRWIVTEKTDPAVQDDDFLTLVNP